MTVITCVRHGRTAWNADGRFQGHTDVPLDEAGMEQAAFAALRLRTERFDAAVASDLARAAETARIILNGREIGLSLDRCWREMSFGEWEGLTWPQIEQRYPQTGGKSPRDMVAPGGESFDDLCARVDDGVRALRARFPGNASVLIVSHAGTLHALLRVLGLAASGEFRIKFLPASISRFAERDGRWEIRGLNTVDGPINVYPAGLLHSGT
jgi:broad specificity phosphatase PhoE